MSDQPVVQSKDLRFYRRPWFFLASALLFWPLAVILMWTGNTYYYKRGVGIVPLGRGLKAFLSVCMILLGLLYFARLAGDQPPPSGETANETPAAPKDEPETTADSGASANAQTSQKPPAQIPTPSSSGALDACDSESTKASVKEILERDSTKVLDMGDFKEIKCPTDRETTLDCVKPGGKERYCDATAYLDTGGTTPIRYHLFYGPSGKPLIELQEGTWTDYAGLVKALSEPPAGQADQAPSDDSANQHPSDTDGK